MRRWLVIAATSVLIVATFVAIRTLARNVPAEGPFDLLVRNGRLLDGTGSPPRRGDVAIRDGRIVALGPLDRATAVRVIDAGGRLVTPGFIDTHSHAADGLVRLGLQQGGPLLAQGITTILANPDGSGPVDLPEQVAELQAHGLGVNVGLMIGHGSVRRAVLGMADRAPTPDELDRMKRLVRAAMDAGAVGLSSGLFYAPGCYAATDEVVALMRVVAEYGGVHQSHVRDEGDYSIGLVAAVDEIIRIAEATGTVGVISHLKALGPDIWGLAATAVTRIEQARARGARVFADQYPYDASSTGLAGALAPRWAQAGGTIRMRQRFAAADTRLRALADVRANLRRRGGPPSIFIAHYGPNRAYEGRTLAQIAAAQRLSPEEAVLDLLMQGDASIVSFNMSEGDIALVMRQPWTMTASDGGLVFPTEGRPHPRNYGAFTRKLERYVREQGTVALEAGVRSMTELPATVYALRDRGELREGAWADVAVFDLADIHETSTYADPHRLARGMAYVIVNGVIVIDNGRFTPALPGKVLLRELAERDAPPSGSATAPRER